MSENRKITVSEIQAVGSILKNREALELLKKINDEIVTEEDTKGKRKQNDIFAFVGFAHQDDVLGEDPESEDFKNKQGSLKALVDKGLILEGAYIPLERKNEKKFGDVRLPATQDKIGKFKLTEEGLAVLALVTKQPGQQQQVSGGSVNNKVQKQSEPQPQTKKEKAIQTFKEEIKEENKL
jgi:hypothetical protein